MRKTILLEGERRATIDIPYDKFMTTGDRIKQTTQCCQQGIVITPCCKGRDSLQIKKMVYELELAYDEDTKQLKDKISEVERSRDEFKQ